MDILCQWLEIFQEDRLISTEKSGSAISLVLVNIANECKFVVFISLINAAFITIYVHYPDFLCQPFLIQA